MKLFKTVLLATTGSNASALEAYAVKPLEDLDALWLVPLQAV